MYDHQLADALVEIERLKAEIKLTEDIAEECRKEGLKALRDNGCLRTALRETREALVSRVDVEIDEHHCKYCGGWEHVGQAIRHEADCPVAVLARHAHLAGEETPHA